MDSARLIINNRDLSTATVATDTPVTGFTVIKAPKGPITPIRIPAGDKAKIQDIFGVLSKDYPDLLEVNTFNEEFDLYVSAPYQEGDSRGTGSQVPVAYVTSKGIFAGENLIPYTRELEKIALGEATGEEKPLGLSFANDDDEEVILKDTRYPKATGYFPSVVLEDYSGVKKDFNNQAAEATELPAYPNWLLDSLLISTGVTANSFQNLIGKADDYHDSDSAITVLTFIDEKNGKQPHYVPGIEFIIKDIPNQKNIELFLSLDPTYTTDEKKDPAIYNTGGKIFLKPVGEGNGKLVWKDNPVAHMGVQGAEIPEKILDLQKSVGASLSTAVGYLAIDSTPSSATSVTDRFLPAFTVKGAKVKAAASGETVTEDSTEAPEAPESSTGKDLVLNYNNEKSAYFVIAGKDFFYKETANAESATIKPSTELSADNLKLYFADEEERSKITTAYLDKIKHKEIYAAICPKFPSNREIKISFDPFNKSKGYSKDTVYGRNLLNMTVSEKGSFRGSTKIEASLDETAKNGYDAYLGFNKNTAYLNQDFIIVYINKKFQNKEELTALPVEIKKYAPITLKGGVRVFPKATEEETNVIKDGKIYEKGWEEALKDEYADIDIFFESRSYPVVNDQKNLGNIGITEFGRTFFNIAREHELAGYIFNRTVDPNFGGAAPDSGAGRLDDVVVTEIEPMSVGARYWNVCNQAIVETIGSGERFMSPLTGSRARMQARIIKNRWGGIAPMYLNSGTPAMGGQLPSLSGATIVNLRYKYNKNQQMILDALNYNPIIKDSTYGVMSVGQKTCQGGALTDWSYIGHVCSFLNFQKEVRNDVMIPQLGKANNDYYRSLRKQQVEAILARRTTGSNRIWAQGVVDTSTAAGVNDEVNRRARKFIIDVKVKVDIFSEFVELNFTNVDQGVDLV